ncbi:MAG TPA: prolyl-tRNA synthetase associated domain-containing protein [Saliniramus sp.]|nr:prolyl-tRNA synthetase associated domain-containing protein [Saliniramus sp.]
MKTTPEDLLARLAALGIESGTVEHVAVFTVAESKFIKESIPGGHTKNLFLKDKKGRIFLVTAQSEAQIDLKRLHETIGASGRVSFGSAELLGEVLGVEPGSVTPLALVNDVEGRVSFVLDETLTSYDVINVHPLVNTMTTSIAARDLLAFLRETGHEPRVLALPAPPSDTTSGDTGLTGAPNPS